MTGATCGTGNARTPDFTPFGEFMISPIHYTHYLLLNLSVLGQVYGLMTGLFAGLVRLLCLGLILLCTCFKQSRSSFHPSTILFCCYFLFTHVYS